MGETAFAVASDEQREHRLRLEAAELMEALQKAAAGHVLSGPELDTWLDALDGDEEPEVPRLAPKSE